MPQRQRLRLLATLLFLVLALSFLWCTIDNIILGAEKAKPAVEIQVTALTIAGAMLWLVGHGIHGAAVIALPMLLWRRSGAGEQIHAY